MDIIIASSNTGKVEEIASYLDTLPLTLIAQSAYPISPIEETGLSFIENALLKARHASQHSGLPALADDSGLAVDALQGAPGIYSARYAGLAATDQQNIEKLIREMASVPSDQRQAHFYCALAFVRHAHDPAPLIALGQWDGTLLQAPQGDQGFGYDPIFYVPEAQCSAAELSVTQKNIISHRAKAMAILKNLLIELNVIK